MQQLHSRRLADIAASTDLSTKVAEADKENQQRIAQLKQDWRDQRPEQGDLEPMEALARLTKFETRVLQLQQEYRFNSAAKEALGLSVRSSSHGHSRDVDIESILRAVQASMGGSAKPVASRISLEAAAQISSPLTSVIEEVLALNRVWSSIVTVWEHYGKPSNLCPLTMHAHIVT